MSVSVSAKDLAECVKEFYDELSRTPNERYLSWEHCYEVFNVGTSDVDYLSLHLAFYLASWGMYRGSSFLLQRDYKIHHGAVKILLRNEFKDLRGVQCRDLSPERIEKIVSLYQQLEKFYKPIREEVQKYHRDIKRTNDKVKSDVSQTLITKILMGTLGCCPAYDRYFVRGARKCGFSGRFSTQSIRELVDFYEGNQDVFNKVVRKTKNSLAYPQMKILDMAFWKFGFNREPETKKQIRIH